MTCRSNRVRVEGKRPQPSFLTLTCGEQPCGAPRDASKFRAFERSSQLPFAPWSRRRQRRPCIEIESGASGEEGKALRGTRAFRQCWNARDI